MQRTSLGPPESKQASARRFGLRTTSRQASVGPGRRVAVFFLWSILAALGMATGFAVVAGLTSSAAQGEPNPGSSGSEPLAVGISSAPKEVSPLDPKAWKQLVALPRSAEGSIFTLGSVTVKPTDVECGISRLVDWSLPGGQYCAILFIAESPETTSNRLQAQRQAVFSRDLSADGYSGSFFLSDGQKISQELVIPPGTSLSAALIVDAPQGFTPAYAMFDPSA